MTKTIYLFASLVIFTTTIYSRSYHNPLDSTIIQKEKRAKNIILLIGDGMGLAQIHAGMTANKNHLILEQFKCIGFSKTNSANKYITDSGAGGTALSTGHKTNNGYIGVDTLCKSLKTILEIAEDNNLATGLVSTSSITHATPASFIAHNCNRNKYEEIAEDFLKTDIDVFIGGGKDNFNKRKDNKNLVDELKKKGYTITDTITDFVNLKTSKLAGFTSKGHNPSILAGRGNMLPLSTQVAIDILKQNKKGFFMMVEGSQIDWGGHENNIEYITSEMIDFDKAIGVALEFAKKDGNTLVIVTADHETGGLAIQGGDIKTGKVEAKFAGKDHSGIMVPVFAFGPGSEIFTGVQDNTDIFKKCVKLLGLKH